MSNEDPFASFESDRTFVMPSPGPHGLRGPRAHAGPRAVDVGSIDDASIAPEALIPAKGINPIVTAASSLLNAVPPLRASATQPDPAALRETLEEGVRAFERRARELGVEQRNVIAARYVLCTFLDEAAAGTPWGGSGVWAGHSLLVKFHNETWGGEKVFQLMAKLAENPSANRDLLELLYVVLALGFEGRYHVIDDGRGQLAKLRERLYAILRGQRGDFERELSPHAGGVVARHSMMARVPMWVVLAVAGVLALGLYLSLSARLNTLSDPVFARIQALRPQVSAAPIPAALAPASRPRLSAYLQSEIIAGHVAVADFADRSVITLPGEELFEPASATLNGQVLPLLQRIGEALNAVGGPIRVTGHTDSQPIRSARFPSNWHLSEERALSVHALLARSVEPGRMRTEGRADAEPVASNATPAGRARNRRVEITLFMDSANR